MRKIREKIEIRCPICDEGIIEVFYFPETKKDNLTTTVGGKRFKTTYTSKEKHEVITNCPKCGASKEKIQKIFDTGQDYKKPSREKVLERLKASGLATRI